MVDSRVKGSQFERDVVKVFRDYSFLQADRRLAGQLDDKGDIQGVPDLTIECKNHANVAVALRSAVDEARQARVRTGTKHYVGVVKRRGKPATEAYAVMALEDFLEIWYRMAQYLYSYEPPPPPAIIPGQLSLEDET